MTMADPSWADRSWNWEKFSRFAWVCLVKIPQPHMTKAKKNKVKRKIKHTLFRCTHRTVNMHFCGAYSKLKSSHHISYHRIRWNQILILNHSCIKLLRHSITLMGKANSLDIFQKSHILTHSLIAHFVGNVSWAPHLEFKIMKWPSKAFKGECNLCALLSALIWYLPPKNCFYLQNSFSHSE